MNSSPPLPELNVPFHPRDISAKLINSVSFSLFAVFATRCLWDIMNVATGGFHGFLSVDVPDNDWWKQLVLFSVFFLWEIIPSLLVLVIFLPVPKTHLRHHPHLPSSRVPASSAGRSRGGTGGSLPDFSSPSAMAAPLETDARYDSDGSGEDERRPLARAHPAPPPVSVLRAPLPPIAGSSWSAFTSTGAYRCEKRKTNTENLLHIKQK